MEGLHILQVDDKIIEVIQVDANGGQKVLHKVELFQWTAGRLAWRWQIMEQINEELQ